MSRPRVAVVGAGLTGLATAWHLREDTEVVVFEAGPRLGGQIRTMAFAGRPLDVGADAFLARQPAGLALARAAGFGEDDLVVPATGQVHLWRGDRLRPLPTGTVLGAPAELTSLARSRVLSPAELTRAALEPVLPRRSVSGDRSVADLVGERFGPAVVERLVEPLLGGVYAGDTARLSAEATLGPVWAAAREHRSLRTGLRAHRARSAADERPVFTTLRGGLSRLVERLASDLGDRVRPRAPVSGLGREAVGWRVELDPSATPDPSRDADAGGRGDGGADEDGVADRAGLFDAVVVAVPAPAAATLLRGVVPEAARELAGIRTASVGVVALAYGRADATDAPPGSGVLVPRSEGRLLKAITVSSRKWPHHAGGDAFVVRASVGRVDEPSALALDDDELAERVDAEVRWALRLRAPAHERAVVRWPGALPQYDVGHRARVDRVRLAVEAAGARGLHVGGAGLDGVGLAARARDAERLTTAVRRHLAGS